MTASSRPGRDDRLLRTVAGALLVGAIGCRPAGPPRTGLSTVALGRQTISVRIQATGVLEPVDPVEMKSKTAGLVTRLPVDVGQMVRRGDLVAQIDQRDVTSMLEQAVADDVVASAAMRRERSARVRADSLFSERVLNASEHDSSSSTYAAAVSDLVRARTNVDLARQALEDATIRSPIEGTVIVRDVAQGQIITPATSAGGGTSLMTIADLDHVRMRVTVNEVEMGNIRVGLPTMVDVDALPDREFEGKVEKVEPEAIVDQGVTFFPVLVTVDNREHLLMPGMNGEVTIRSTDRPNVIAVPIDAVRGPTELAAIGRLFGMSADSLSSLLRPELISTTSQESARAHFVVVALPDGGYEMRLVHLGASDFVTAEVLDGVSANDRVVLLGGLTNERSPNPPQLRIAGGIGKR